MLMPLCVTYGFAPAGAATFVAARAKGDMYPRPAPLRETFLPLPAPPCRMTMRRGIVAPGSLTLTPPAVKVTYQRHAIIEQH